MARQPSPRTLTIEWRIIAAVMAVILTAFAVNGCATYEKARKMYEELNHPYGGPPLTDEQKIALIDCMRAKGSYEATRERLTDTARVIAERITAAVPGQTWKFNEDSYGQDAYRDGSSCEKLSGGIARRPSAKPVDLGTTFSAEGFTTAVGIVRQEAAAYGATTQSSLFNESAKRDYQVQGNGYDFNLGQIKFATLLIRGDCLLLQKVLDLPPGQLPPEPPIIPTTTPT